MHKEASLILDRARLEIEREKESSIWKASCGFSYWIINKSFRGKVEEQAKGINNDHY